MATYMYLKKGPMSQRPYHIQSGEAALCGRVRLGENGVATVRCGPEPMPEGLVCERCRQVAAVEAVKRVAAASPFTAHE